MRYHRKSHIQHLSVGVLLLVIGAQSVNAGDEADFVGAWIRAHPSEEVSVFHPELLVVSRVDEWFLVVNANVNESSSYWLYRFEDGKLISEDRHETVELSLDDDYTEVIYGVGTAGSYRRGETLRYERLDSSRFSPYIEHFDLRGP